MNTYSTLNVPVGTTRKSIATVPARCIHRDAPSAASAQGASPSQRLALARSHGVFYGMVVALSAAEKSPFFAALGDAIEAYLRSSLSRFAASVPGSAVAWVGKEDVRRASPIMRCDAAWRIGEELVLFDAKRLFVSSAILEGQDGLSRRLDEQVGHACAVERREDARRCGRETRLSALEPGPVVERATGAWRPPRDLGASSIACTSCVNRTDTAGSCRASVRSEPPSSWLSSRGYQ
jgi:hypothetical protein